MNDLLLGGLAGCAATAPMTGAMQALYLLLPASERYPLPPRLITENLGEWAGGWGRLNERQRLAATLLAHFGVGTAAGALYGVLGRRLPLSAPLAGAAFGLAVWAGNYLALLPALGLLAPATRHPPRRTALQVIGHLVWGLAAGLLVGGRGTANDNGDGRQEVVVETVGRTKDIETGSDLAFERRWWRVEWVAWAVMAVLVAAGLAGVFGRGPADKAVAESPGGELRVEYERFARTQTPATLEVRLGRQALAAGHVDVRLNGTLLGTLGVHAAVPRAVAVRPSGEGASFRFVTDPERGDAKVVFTEKPSGPGLYEGEVTVEGAGTVRFRQFVYP